MSDFVYLALTLISFAGLALLAGILGSRLDPAPDPTDPTDPTDHDAGHEADAPSPAVRR